MKKLTIKEVLITIIISYLIVSYINNEFNPFNLSLEARVIQIFLIGVSIFTQLMMKNLH
jgi:hypothetical protein